MKFSETELPGVYQIDLQEISDERGFFARGWCATEFAEHGLAANISQINVSQNHAAGTVRGMHMQIAPHEEAKLVRCSRGAIFDVAVDMRPSSAHYLQWFGCELSASNRRALFVPEGFAHGYQTLCDDTEVFYLVSESYAPGAEFGFRYDDPKVAIRWPGEFNVVSDKDRQWSPL